jgi:hypothetical protein
MTRQAWFKVINYWVDERGLDPKAWEGCELVSTTRDDTHTTFIIGHRQFPPVATPQECSPEIVFPRWKRKPYPLRLLLADGTEITARGIKPIGWRGS